MPQLNLGTILCICAVVCAMHVTLAQGSNASQGIHNRSLASDPTRENVRVTEQMARASIIAWLDATPELQRCVRDPPGEVSWTRVSMYFLVWFIFTAWFTTLPIFAWNFLSAWIEVAKTADLTELGQQCVSREDPDPRKRARDVSPVRTILVRRTPLEEYPAWCRTRAYKWGDKVNLFHWNGDNAVNWSILVWNLIAMIYAGMEVYNEYYAIFRENLQHIKQASEWCCDPDNRWKWERCIGLHTEHEFGTLYKRALSSLWIAIGVLQALGLKTIVVTVSGVVYKLFNVPGFGGFCKNWFSGSRKQRKGANPKAPAQKKHTLAELKAMLVEFKNKNPQKKEEVGPTSNLRKNDAEAKCIALGLLKANN